jgi:transposase
MRREPLADYLEPQFGNIYVYNLVEQNGFDVQPWTDELRQAVNHYLVHEVTDDEYAAFLSQFEHEYEMPLGGREGQVEFIMKVAEAWEIAYAFHLAAVSAVPTLDALIGHLKNWPREDQPWGAEDEQWDAAAWLDAHASQEQLHALADIVSHGWVSTWEQDQAGWDSWLFTEYLTPSQLLRVWHQVIDPAESDLTDDEWQLLLPVYSQRRLGDGGSRQRSDQELRSLRAALDGLRYKSTHRVPWSKVPARYGKAYSLYQRYCRYQKDGTFVGMFEALDGQPGAERVVEWLKNT